MCLSTTCIRSSSAGLCFGGKVLHPSCSEADLRVFPLEGRSQDLFFPWVWEMNTKWDRNWWRSWMCASTYWCFRGWGLGRAVEGWSASDPWERNLFPFVALQFLTGLPRHMSIMGLFLLSGLPEKPSHPPAPTSPAPPPPYQPTFPVLLVPKAIGIPGGHQWSSFRRKTAGSWVASCTRALRGGDNVLLIDWASSAQCRNLQKGETEELGWGMGREGHRGRTSVCDLFQIDLHDCRKVRDSAVLFDVFLNIYNLLLFAHFITTDAQISLFKCESKVPRFIENGEHPLWFSLKKTMASFFSSSDLLFEFLRHIFEFKTNIPTERWRECPSVCGPTPSWWAHTDFFFLPFLCKVDGVGQAKKGGGGGWDGCAISPCGPPQVSSP